MANVDRAGGFRPVGHLSGSSYSGSVREYSVDSGYGTAIFVGDAVAVTGASDSDGIANVGAAAADAVITGVVVGVVVDKAVAATEHPGYLPASTGGKVLVNDDPMTLFSVQEDSAGGAAGTAAVGDTCNHVAGAGSTVTGNSGHEIDSSDVGTGLGFIIVGAEKRVDNEVANTSAKFIVKINEHQFSSNSAGA